MPPRLPNLFPNGKWEDLVAGALRRPCHVCGAKAGDPCRRFSQADDGSPLDPTGPPRAEPHRSRMIP